MKKAETTGPAYLHGWAFQHGFWHGPIALAGTGPAVRTTLQKLKNSPGAFHGKLSCCVPGLPWIEFHTAVYDLLDIGVAIMHMDGSSGGPVGVMAVVPASRRKCLRAEFPFEF